MFVMGAALRLSRLIILFYSQHVVSAPQHGPDPVTFVSHAANTLALHSLDADAFPLPYHTLAERPLSGQHLLRTVLRS
jgi:hypothetical protein